MVPAGLHSIRMIVGIFCMILFGVDKYFSCINCHISKSETAMLPNQASKSADVLTDGIKHSPQLLWMEIGGSPKHKVADTM